MLKMQIQNCEENKEKNQHSPYSLVLEMALVNVGSILIKEWLLRLKANRAFAYKWT